MSEQLPVPPLVAADAQGEFFVPPERIARDAPLLASIKEGFTYAIDEETGKVLPLAEGNLTPDAQVALGKLWDYYFPQAASVANERAGLIERLPAIEVDDLIHHGGYFGLLHSAVKWDPTKHKVSFLTHARSQMRTYRDRYITSHRTNVRLPHNVSEDARKIDDTLATRQRDEWEPEVGYADRQPSAREDLARKFELKPEDLEDLLQAETLAERMGSLDGDLFEGGTDAPVATEHASVRNEVHQIDPTATEIPATEDAFDSRNLQESVVKALRNAGLTGEELTVLVGRHLVPEGPLTKEKVGKLIGRSATRVGTVEQTVFAKLRHGGIFEHLRGMLPED